MKPLAYRIRPKEFNDIIGQDHLVGPKGVITKMVNQNKIYSMILYGPAGCGKTSIASIISSLNPLSSFEFNASCDSKAKLKEIADSAKFYEKCGGKQIDTCYFKLGNNEYKENLYLFDL